MSTMLGWAIGALATLVAVLVITSEVKWVRQVTRAYEKQRAAYATYTDAFTAGDVRKIEEAEDAILAAGSELRALRRWYPWRRI